MHIGSDNATTDAGMTEDHFSESMSKGTTPGPVTSGGNENNDNSNNSYGKNKITNTNSLMTNIGTTDFSGTTGINLSSITNRPFTIASITKVVLINNETNIDTTEYSETKTSTNIAKSTKAITKILSTTVDTNDAETNSDTSDDPKTTNKRSKVFSNDVQSTN